MEGLPPAVHSTEELQRIEQERNMNSAKTEYYSAAVISNNSTIKATESAEEVEAVEETETPELEDVSEKAKGFDFGPNNDDEDRDSEDAEGLAQVATNGSKIVIYFEPNESEDPANWSNTRKAIIVSIGIISVLNSTLGSSIPNGDLPELGKHYGISSDEELVLPTSIFLIGYVLGPMAFAPLSESYGRKLLMLWPFAGFTLFTGLTCIAPDYGSFIFFRLMIGIFASSPISVTGGIYADLYTNAVHRGRAMAAFMTATSIGPAIAPAISGYLGVFGWRWPYLFVLIAAGVSWIPLLLLPETHVPTLLKHRARKLRKEDPSMHVYAEIELEHTSTRDLLTRILARPFKMLFREPIVFCSCLYLSMIYAVYYMFFQAYPLIFPPIYGFSLGAEGLTFMAIGGGSVLACMVYLWWDRRVRVAKARGAPWADLGEWQRLPVGCIGGPLFTIGMFWLGWTARKEVPWPVPMLSGFSTGMGFLLLFMSLVNYIVDAYDVFAASAIAATTVSRSMFGAAVPFGATPMFETLGIAWACSLLGFVSLAMAVIPFLFIRYGHVLRERSAFCQELIKVKAERAATQERRQARQRLRQQQSAKPQHSVAADHGEKKGEDFSRPPSEYGSDNNV